MTSVNEKTCIGCGLCLAVCPGNAIVLYNSKARIDTQRCTDCGQCISVCPSNAITETAISQIDELKKRLANIKQRVTSLSRNINYLAGKK